MSRRFKASKYKNAAPKQQVHAPWIRDLSVGSYNCFGNFIKASAAFTAFNINPTGSQLGVVALDNEGQVPVTGYNVSILNAHSDLVTDFDFSPFEDGLLATCSADSTIKIWSINLKNLNDLSVLTPECTTSSKHRRVETLCFHPTAECLLTFTSQNALSLWDILHNKELMHDDCIHKDKIISMSWSKNGELLATCCKDKFVRLVDPRTTEVVATAVNHKNDKDSRVVWLGDSQFVLTSGFDSSRMRQIFVRDTRKFETPVKTIEFDSSTGILMPLFDTDTNMMFLAGRGDSSISYFEFNSDVDDFLLEGYRYNGEQTKGACLLPKRALKVMDTEVNRILQLTANSVISIPYYVPRKTYIDFHQDLFPDTKGTKTSGSAAAWMDGHNGTVFNQSLNPSAPKEPPHFLGDSTLRVFKPPLIVRRVEEQASINKILESGNDYKKDIPEPRPRKKSLTPCSSMEEAGDADVVGSPSSTVMNPSKFFPVPKPRVSNNATTTSGLRTPSSFISRMAADFSSHRSTSKDDTENHNNGYSSLPDFTTGTNQNTTTTEEVLNGNFHTNGNNDSPIEVENGCRGDFTAENGNSLHDDEDDEMKMSTSDRRKMFENSLQETNPQSVGATTCSTNGGANNLSPGARQARVTVAERLKLYQQNANNGGSSGDDCNGDHLSQDGHQNNPPETKMSTSSSHHSSLASAANKDKEQREFCPAPIAKPERKYTPPKSEPPCKSLDSVPQPASSVTTKTTTTKRIDTVFGQVSKYRNFKVNPLHRKYHLENLRNISPTCPGESEAIQANPARVAVPLNTPGGKLAVFELNRTGRQPDGVIPALVHGSKIMDFTWDPFDNTRLAVGCDDGKLSIWRIPETGLKEQTNEPEFTIPAHGEKIYICKFHPLAVDVLATASYDLSIRIWDLDKKEGLFHISCLDQIQVLSLTWSPCGALLATMSKDSKIRIYEPRVSVEPQLEGQGPIGVRSGRACWAIDGQFLIVSGFEKNSERQIQMYSAKDLSRVAAFPLDVSPTILVPFYDEDSSILFLYGRGDSTILAFDITDEAPYLKQVNQHRLTGGHQGIAFLKKNAVDVQNVEFAKAYRLTDVVIEPLSFTVPRVKSEYFQDDLFPPTKVLWEPTMSADNWVHGMNLEPRRVSLKPESMKAVGDIGAGFFKQDNKSLEKSSTQKGKLSSEKVTKSSPVVSFGNRFTDSLDNGEKKQAEQLEKAIKEKLEINMTLEQDNMEGVDEEEWTE